MGSTILRLARPVVCVVRALKVNTGADPPTPGDFRHFFLYKPSAPAPAARPLPPCDMLRRPDDGLAGLADALFAGAAAWAAGRGARRLVSWSDTRFERAHAFYARHGLSRFAVRQMTDGVVPYSEYGFAKDL